MLKWLSCVILQFWIVIPTAAKEPLTASPKSCTDILAEELIKTIPKAGLTVFGALLAWLVGKRIAFYWAIRQKQREIELSALNEFYSVYGEFFAVWKLWNLHIDETKQPAEKEKTSQLLERALLAESRVESLLVKIASERKLDDDTVKDLGLLRQAFQHLRETMQEKRKLHWWHSGHKQYMALKKLATRVTELLSLSRRSLLRRLLPKEFKRPTRDEATEQLLKITDNSHEGRWMELAADELRNFMTELSKRLFKKDWKPNLEYELWSAVQGKTASSLRERDLDRLRGLAKDCDGWIICEEDGSRPFIERSKWIKRVSKWTERGGCLEKPAGNRGKHQLTNRLESDTRKACAAQTRR